LAKNDLFFPRGLGWAEVPLLEPGFTSQCFSPEKRIVTHEYVALMRQIDEMGDPVLPPEPEKSYIDLSRLSPEDKSTLDRILKAATPSPAASLTA
jgi:hypothetical protein